MTTLSQLEKLLEQGRELKEELDAVDYRLSRFAALEGDVVPCRAFAAQTTMDFGRGGGLYVEVMPVAKSVVISALQRERSKILQRLRDLGVEADEPASEPLINHPAPGSGRPYGAE